MSIKFYRVTCGECNKEFETPTPYCKPYQCEDCYDKWVDSEMEEKEINDA